MAAGLAPLGIASMRPHAQLPRERVPPHDVQGSLVERKLSILLFGTQMAIGGAQRVLLDQARWFRAHGHRVTAVFFYDKEGLQDAWQHRTGMPLLTVTRLQDQGLISKAWALIQGLFGLWKLLRHEHFDVIETFTYDSNLLALPLAWLAGVPVRIATHHGIIEGFPRGLERLHSWLVNARIASILVSVSTKALEQAAKAGAKRERMIVIQNGIVPAAADPSSGSSVRREMGLAEADVLLLSVGRLVYQKGHEFLIRAMPRVLARHPRAKAVVCGEGALRGALQAQIAELRLEGSVFLEGNRPDIDRFLSAADIFVLPSRWEGLPVALLEAMAVGLPVVATHVEGVEEVVQNQAQGLLVPPGDPEALAAALIELLGRDEARRRMGEAARRRIEESYTVDIMCGKYLRVMSDLMDSHAGG
jgi:glycosyltransferase involved in cell wall biosynthesis